MAKSEPKIALIDADFLMYSVGFACEDDEDPQMAKNRLTEWLTDIVYMDLQCDDYVAFTTGPGNFRYDVAKTVPYKGNRKDMKRPKHLDALKEHLKRLGAVETQGIEADDAVAMKMTEEPGKYILVGVDKDLMQIPGWHYNPNKCEKVYVDEFQAAYNFWTQMLTGDRVDNIPGLAGIGPKKAEKILKDCTSAEEMAHAVWCVYQDKGHDYEYFVEQGRLLWLQRKPDEVWQPSVSTQQSKLDESTDSSQA
jgi:5'-3' exonuclease